MQEQIAEAFFRDALSRGRHRPPLGRRGGSLRVAGRQQDRQLMRGQPSGGCVSDFAATSETALRRDACGTAKTLGRRRPAP